MSNKSVAINAAITDLWNEFKKLIKLIFTTYNEPPQHDYPVKLLSIEIDGGVVAFFRFQDQGWQANSKVTYFPADDNDAKNILKEVLGGLEWLPFNNALTSDAAACEVNHHSAYKEYVNQIIACFPEELPDHTGYAGNFAHTIQASNYPTDLPTPQVRVNIHYGTYLYYTPVSTQHFSDEQLEKIFPTVSLEHDVDAPPPMED